MESLIQGPIFTEIQVFKIPDFETGSPDSRGPFSKFTKDKIKRDSDFKLGLNAEISRLTLIFYETHHFPSTGSQNLF